MTGAHDTQWSDLTTEDFFSFGKNLALSYQNKEKHRFSKRMWPLGQKAHMTTEETVALVELVNSIQNDTTDTSHTRNTGKGKAAKPIAETMEQKPGEEATDVPLQTGIAREGEGGDIEPPGQQEQQTNNEDSALNDIPEWLLEENIRLN